MLICLTVRLEALACACLLLAAPVGCAADRDAPTLSAPASATAGDPPADLDIALPPVVGVPLGGLAEIEVLLRGEEIPRATEISVDTSEPGLVAVSGVISRFETVGVIRLGAREPFTVGTTFTLHVTARAGSRAGTATTRATVVDKAGALDPSFGDAGIFVAAGTKYSRDGFTDMEVQADGGILAAGPHGTIAGDVFRAVSVRADGAADPAWAAARSDRAWIDSHGGVVIRGPDGPKHASATAICRQSTGRVVVAGTDHHLGRDRIALVGLSSTGTLDRSFGDRGVRMLSPEADTTALTLAVAPDDGLVVAGHQGRRAVVARLLPHGSPDPRFGEGGYVVFDPLYGVTSEVRSVAIDSAGRVLAAGVAGTRAFIMRLQPDGGEYPGLRLGRELPTPEPTDVASAQHVMISPEGKIVVGGLVRRGSSSFVALWRLLESGEADERVGWRSGVRGLVMAPFFGSADGLGGLALLPDGRAVIAINVDVRPYGDTKHAEPFLLRLTPDGSPDPSFGSRGFVRVALSQGNAVQALGLAEDGKLLLGLRLGPAASGAAHAGIARVWL